MTAREHYLVALEADHSGRWNRVCQRFELRVR